MARKPVKRHTRNYQFRDEHPFDQHVDSILDYWKSDKREITTLRKAVDLYYALEQGNVDALFDTFPQYKIIKDGSGGAGDGKRILELLELIAANVKSNNGIQMQSLKPTTGKQIAAPNSIAMPNFDDDELPALTISKDTKTNASLNFMASLGGLQ